MNINTQNVGSIATAVWTQAARTITGFGASVAGFNGASVAIGIGASVSFLSGLPPLVRILTVVVDNPTDVKFYMDNNVQTFQIILPALQNYVITTSGATSGLSIKNSGAVGRNYAYCTLDFNT